MKKVNKVARFILRSFIIIVLTCLFVLPNTGCFNAGKFSPGAINVNLYTSFGQMNKLIDDLNCDTSSMKAEDGSIVRLAHNNGEPIYVTFDDAVPEDMRIASIKSLDYIFGLVHEFNPYYEYEVVDYDKYVASKSNIRYSMYNEAESDVKNASAYAHRTAYGGYYATNLICINESLVNRSSNYINYVLTHELLHIFGFEDVYNYGSVKNTNDYFDNTFLNISDIYIENGLISPNDYKFLLSAYTPKTAFSNYNETIQGYEKLIEDYSVEFFNTVTTWSLKNKTDKLLDATLDTSIELNVSSEEKYVISSNGENYSLDIIKGDVIVESINGKITYVEIGEANRSVAILTDINSTALASSGKFSNSSAVHTNLILFNQINSNAASEYKLSKLTGMQLA